ncbi:MAG: hypothetical protein GX442_20390 [Candidatus Riflebacteria bacterium]|nr:hypothetical protein [Candidatus Riflebacteria bacterium]
MRRISALMVVLVLVFASVPVTGSAQPGFQEPQAGPRPPGRHEGPPGPHDGPRDGPRGPHHPPSDLVFIGLTTKGEETKPFLVSIPPLGTPGKPGTAPAPRTLDKQAPKEQPAPQPPAPNGFLSIDGQGHVLVNLQITFMEKGENMPDPPLVQSIKASILDLAPPAIDPGEMREKTEEERQQIWKEFEEALKSAKEAGTLEMTFAIRKDLKNPIMADISVLIGQGAATVNGEEYKFLFLAPPPPPHPWPGEGPREGPPGGMMPPMPEGGH